MNKNYFLVLLSALIFSFLFLSSLIFLLDPFGQRKLVNSFDPEFKRIYLSSFLQFEDYDSLIIGSSVTHNFSTKDFTDLLGWKKPVLASVAGMLLDETAEVLRKAEEHGFSKAFILIDHFSLTGSPPKAVNKGKMRFAPSYLYDKNGILKNFRYLLDYKEALPFIGKKLFDPESSFILSSQWEKSYNFDTLEGRHKNFMPFFNPTWWHGAPLIENLREKTIENFPYAQETARQSIEELLIPFIERNPDKDFYISVSPYSALIWKGFNFEDIIQSRITLAKMLTKYSNVYLYDLSSSWEATSNLTNYLDAIHLTAPTSQLIVKELSKKENRITEDTLDNYLIILRDYQEKLKTFDFEKALKEYKLPLIEPFQDF